MNKKGFTLVELLAVIAILVILVIIALPNVMGMFNTAKKRSFYNEVRIIYNAAEETYFSDSFNNNGSLVYARSEIENSCQRKLDLSGRTNLYYYVELNKYGKIQRIYVKDDKFQYVLEKNDIQLTDILLEDVTEPEEDDEKLYISCNLVNAGIPILPAGSDPDDYVEPETPVHYTIVYEKNDDQAVGVMERSTHTTGVEEKLSANEFSKDGYSFSVWNTKPDGTGDTYTDEQTIYNLTTEENAEIHLYAQWTKDAVRDSFVIADSKKGTNNMRIEFVYTYNQQSNTAKVTVTHADFKTFVYQLYLGPAQKDNKTNYISIGGTRLTYKTGTKYKDYFNSWEGGAGISASKNKDNRYNLRRPSSHTITDFKTIDIPSSQIVDHKIDFTFYFMTYSTQASSSGAKWSWDTTVQFDLLTGQQV